MKPKANSPCSRPGEGRLSTSESPTRSRLPLVEGENSVDYEGRWRAASSSAFRRFDVEAAAQYHLSSKIPFRGHLLSNSGV
jgi:hypothetical protein